MADNIAAVGIQLDAQQLIAAARQVNESFTGMERTSERARDAFGRFVKQGFP